MALETPLVGMRVVLVGMTTLVVAETSVVQVALVVALVVAENMVAVGMVMMDLVTPGAGLEVAEATGILAVNHDHHSLGFGSMKGQELWLPW